jgi:putative transcriptional regulator
LIDLDFNTKQKPSPGSILIAEPFADDDYFRRSVIFICEYNKKGSFGFVLNNFLDVDFNELSAEQIELKARVSVGGPVDINNLYFLHTYGDEIPGSYKVTDLLYLGGDYKMLISLLKEEKYPEKRARFFLGYSGWNEKQLDQEIENKNWAVIYPDNLDDIMDTTRDNIWNTLLQDLGGKYRLFSNFPINPSNN